MFLKVEQCLFILVSVCVVGSRATLVSVDTPVGQILGVNRENYTMFLGIPYGLVDERNPFGNAKPHPSFTSPLPASDDSTVCPQYDNNGIIKGTIQCLRLNVYKPSVVTPGHTLPVMVFIHGGAFVEGSGGSNMYSPPSLVKHDVIVVTVNYRLGPYGNLCFPDSEYSNQALKDQNLALKWVKSNIGSFGGDSENILLFGHSSGSISTEFQLLYNNEKLFNKVILQSGVAITPLCNQATDMATFAKAVGEDGENIDVDRFIKTISTIDSNTIINITKSYDFRPCIDGKFIFKTPKINNLRDIKLMIGGTRQEMLYFYPTADKEEQFDLGAELNNAFSVSKMAGNGDFINLIKSFYLENKKLNILDLESDLAFNYPIDRAVRYYVRNKCTVYRYLFTYEGKRNYMKTRDNITAEGSTHGDELGYLYYMPELESKYGNITKEDQVVVDRMSLLWTNFAKYGDPTPTSSGLLPVKWTPVTTGAKSYLQIDKNLTLHDGRPFERRMAFWDSYYAKYGMYAKGINLGETFTNNRANVRELSGVVLLITVLLLCK